MFRRKPPARRPHPDPARELELQRILDLRASIDRRADLIGQYREEIGRLHRAARMTAFRNEAHDYRGQAQALDARIETLEDAIEQTGAKIAELQAALSPDDLAFL